MNNVPVLRFSEFEGEWVEKKLGNNYYLISGQHLNPDEYTNEKQKSVPYFTGPSDFTNNVEELSKWSLKGGKEAKKGDILFTVKGSGVATCMILSLEKVVMGRQLMAIGSSKASTEFLFQKLPSLQNYYIALASGNMIPGLSRNDLLDTKVFFPSLPEQQKIATFLTAVDKRISLLKEKKAKLEQYKKGVMQQLFSRQIRFKDKNGQDFPVWEEKKLGDIGQIVTGLTYSPNDIDNEGVLVLRSSNIRDRNLAFTDNVYVRVNNYNPVSENDILICVRNGSKSLIGKNAIIKKEDEGYAFGAFMTVFRSSFNQFLFHWFDSDDYKKEVHKNLGATINSINGSDLKKFRIPFPSLPEQQKIASFLSSLDEQIAQVGQQIAQMSSWKKGLLQKMFV